MTNFFIFWEDKMENNMSVLFASPRENGNTASLLAPFIDEVQKNNVDVEKIDLYKKDIKPCIACRNCQKDWSKVGCIIQDDMQEIFEKILKTDYIILATPIYSWFCTAPMKAMLDRLVYGMNKYYGDEKGPAIWAGKKVALLTTYGYPDDKGPNLFEEGMIRYTYHSKLEYLGMLGFRHKSYKIPFMNEEKEAKTREFARKILS